MSRIRIDRRAFLVRIGFRAGPSLLPPEAFLAKHLGGRAQPVGNDCTGSSIQIPIGRDLVSGMPA